jgi:hypothetical protein
MITPMNEAFHVDPPSEVARLEAAADQAESCLRR